MVMESFIKENDFLFAFYLYAKKRETHKQKTDLVTFLFPN